MGKHAKIILVICVFALIITLALLFSDHRERGNKKSLAKQSSGLQVMGQSPIPQEERKEQIKVGSRPEGFSLAVVKEKLAAADKIADIHDRAARRRVLIEELCKAGFSEEAWTLISKDAGFSRNNELDAYFSNTKLSIDEFLAKSADLDKRDKNISLFSWFRQHSSDELLDLLRTDAIPRGLSISSFELSQKVAGYLNFRLFQNDPAGQAKILDDAVKFQKAGLLLTDGFAHVLLSAKFESPFSNWDFLQSASSDPKIEAITEKVRDKLVDQMIKNDAPRAMEAFMKLEGIRATRDIGHAISEWTRMDSAGAYNWYVTHSPAMSKETQSAAATGFFMRAMDSDEIDSAQKWASEIQDEKLKENALRLISDKLAAGEKAK